jgi:hypothetical protein
MPRDFRIRIERSAGVAKLCGIEALQLAYIHAAKLCREFRGTLIKLDERALDRALCLLVLAMRRQINHYEH